MSNNSKIETFEKESTELLGKLLSRHDPIEGEFEEFGALSNLFREFNFLLNLHDGTNMGAKDLPVIPAKDALKSYEAFHAMTTIETARLLLADHNDLPEIGIFNYRDFCVLRNNFHAYSEALAIKEARQADEKEFCKP